MHYNRAANASLVDRQALHMTFVENMIRRLRERMAATLAATPEMDLAAARTMTGMATAEETVAYEGAAAALVQSALGQEAMDEDLPDFDE